MSPHGLKIWVGRSVAGVAILACLASGIAAQGQSDVNTPERNKAQELVDQGIALSDGSPEEERLYLEAQRVDPSYPAPLFNLGFMHAQRGNYEVAKTYLTEYVAYDAPKAQLRDGYRMLGECYRGLGDTVAARNAYGEYLTLAQALIQESETDKLLVNETKATLAMLDGQAGPSEAERLEKKVLEGNKMSVEDIVKALSKKRTRTLKVDPNVVSLNTIQFDVNSAKLRPESKAELDKIAAALKDERLKSYAIRVSGHTSTEGTDEANLKLSAARAESVRKYLTAQGVPAEKLDAKGIGERKPIWNPDQDSNKKMEINRRVEFSNEGVLASMPSRLQ